MMNNHVWLSSDRMEMTITDGDVTANLHSARLDGFTTAEVDKAREMPLNQRLQPGQVNEAWRFNLFGRKMYIHINTGPPVWWLPRLRIRRREVMIGWLSGLIAVAWGPS